MKLDARNKKAFIILGIAVVVFSVLKFAVLPFYDEVKEQKNEIAVKEMTKGKYLKKIKTAQDVQQELVSSTKKQLKIEQSLLTGETTSLAAADIQKIVDGIAKQSAVNVKSVKVMEAGESEGLITIPVKVTFESDLKRTCNFVRKIESNRKLLTIPELKIRVKNRRKPEMISVTIQVAGFMKKHGTGS